MSRQPWGPAAPAPDVSIGGVFGPRVTSTNPIAGLTLDTVYQKFLLTQINFDLSVGFTGAQPGRLANIHTPVDGIFVQAFIGNTVPIRLGVAQQLAALTTGLQGFDIWPGQVLSIEQENSRSITDGLLSWFKALHRCALDAFDFTLASQSGFGSIGVVMLAYKSDEGY